jgi:hypothetical protein
MCGVYKPTNVISLSYGGQEADIPVSYQKRQCLEYMKLGLQGVSFLYASGDSGVSSKQAFPIHDFKLPLTKPRLPSSIRRHRRANRLSRSQRKHFQSHLARYLPLRHERRRHQSIPGLYRQRPRIRSSRPRIPTLLLRRRIQQHLSDPGLPDKSSSELFREAQPAVSVLQRAVTGFE